MVNENIVKNKSFVFAILIVKLNQFLVNNKKEYVLSKQLLRSGTSVGAMVREAEHAESKADFKHKMAIAQKEINETLYWLELLKETDYLSDEQFKSLNADAVELIKLLTSIVWNNENLKALAGAFYLLCCREQSKRRMSADIIYIIGSKRLNTLI